MRNLLRKILPQSLIDFYKLRKKQSRLNERESLLKNNQIVTTAEIINQLKKVGLHAEDVVMVHSALSKMGYVEQGATSVIDAFQEVVGNEGTLMMPAFPAIGFNHDYLNTHPVFDINQTPSKMGVITETFRKQKNVHRSLHPTDSVIAFGKQALYLTKDHFGQLTPYNAQSPFYRLCELKGKIVLIGVDFNSLTNLHTLEDAVENFKYPVYHEQEFDCSLINGSGTKVTMRSKVHNPVYYKKRQCNALIPHSEKAGILKHFKIGLADCMIIDAHGMHEWMVKNYLEKGITMYTPNGN